MTTQSNSTIKWHWEPYELVRLSPEEYKKTVRGFWRWVALMAFVALIEEFARVIFLRNVKADCDNPSNEETTNG